MRPVDIVRTVCPRARLEYVTAFANGDALFLHYGVNSPLRFAHFLAQCMAETGDLSITWENMSYSEQRILEVFGVGHHSAGVTAGEARSLAHNPSALAERVYGMGNPGKARELGNLKTGDAYRLRGGGILQTTGGYNYKKFGKMFGIDLYNHPELILSADHALKPALAEWDQNHCNQYADANDILSISRAINMGNANAKGTPNGMNNRRAAFNRAFPVCRDNGVNLVPGSVSLGPLPMPAPSTAPVGKPKPTSNGTKTGGVVVAGGAAAGAAYQAGFSMTVILLIGAAAAGFAAAWFGREKILTLMADIKNRISTWISDIRAKF